MHQQPPKIPLYLAGRGGLRHGGGKVLPGAVWGAAAGRTAVMAAIKVLVVGDGAYMNYSPPSDGINFLTNSSGSYIQDASDNTFTVSEFIYLITNAGRAITVDTAHRRADPSATY